MAGILSGLEGLGLGDLEKRELYEKEKDHPVRKAALKRKMLEEKDLIFDKSFSCPVCEHNFTSKVMKTGKTRLLSTDLDCRPVYEGIESSKYDVAQCPKCGYSAMVPYFRPLLKTQRELVQENICNHIKMEISEGEIYSYEDMITRYRVALACAIVKHARDSEKAYICLHFAWLLRGYVQKLEEEGHLTAEKEKRLKGQETECLQKALEGLINARQKESLPICGMDQTSLDYMIAAVAYETEKDNVAAKMVSEILVSSIANSRMKDKARDLKQLILERHKK